MKLFFFFLFSVGAFAQLPGGACNSGVVNTTSTVTHGDGSVYTYQCQQTAPSSGIYAWFLISISSPSSTGGATIAHTTNLVAGDGAGNGVDTGIAPGNVRAMATPASVSGLTGWYKSSSLSALSSGASVATWPDSSGNGNALTQATGGAQPVYVTNVFGSAPSVRFTANNGQSMTIPAGATPTTTSFSMCWIGRANETTSNAVYSMVLASLGVDAIWQSQDSPLLGKMGVYNGGGILNSNLTIPARLHVNCIASSSNSTTFFVNDASTTVSTTNTASSPTSGTLGSYSGNYGFFSDVVEFMTYNVPITAAQYATIANYEYAAYGIIHSQEFGRVVLYGNSITAGYTVANGNNYPNQLANALSNENLTVYNLGRDSYSTPQLTSAFAGNVTPVFSNTGQNIIVLFEVRNDLCNNAATAATAYSNMQTLASTAKTAGWKVIAVTPEPSNSCTGTYEADRQTVANAMVAGLVPDGYADAVVDIRQAPLIGAAGANTNATYYASDLIHLTAVGDAVLNSLVWPAINTVGVNYSNVSRTGMIIGQTFAGTPGNSGAVPICNSTLTTTGPVRLFVTDATSPTFNGTYTSGGSVRSSVTCYPGASNWVTP